MWDSFSSVFKALIWAFVKFVFKRRNRMAHSSRLTKEHIKIFSIILEIRVVYYSLFDIPVTFLMICSCQSYLFGFYMWNWLYMRWIASTFFLLNDFYLSNQVWFIHKRKIFLYLRTERLGNKVALATISLLWISRTRNRQKRTTHVYCSSRNTTAFFLQQVWPKIATISIIFSIEKSLCTYQKESKRPRFILSRNIGFCYHDHFEQRYRIVTSCQKVAVRFDTRMVKNPVTATVINFDWFM